MVAGTHLMDDVRFDKWCAALGVVGVAAGLRPGARAAVPRSARGLLRRAALGPRPRRRDRRRPDAHRHRRQQRRWWAGRRPGPAGPRSRRDPPRLPGADLPDDRRSDDHHLELLGGADLAAERRTTSAGRRTSTGGAGPTTSIIYAAPARAVDLAGLPPTFISVGALDGFLDEDVDYATRLLRAGVPTELHVYPGAPHGFDLMLPGTQIARRARRHLDEWIATRLAA